MPRCCALNWEAGTSVRTTTIARMAHQVSVEEAAVAFELQVNQVRAAIDFEAALVAA